MCIRKHLLTIKAYAQETTPMEETEAYKERLQELESEARSRRLSEEASICGEEAGTLEELDHWARKWRKEFEIHALITRAAQDGRAGEGTAAGADRRALASAP